MVLSSNKKSFNNCLAEKFEKSRGLRTKFLIFKGKPSQNHHNIFQFHNLYQNRLKIAQNIKKKQKNMKIPDNSFIHFWKISLKFKFKK